MQGNETIVTSFGSFEPLTRSRWSSAHQADQFAVENPATGELITVVQGSGPSEIESAVEAAREAFESDWRWRVPRERGEYLYKCARLLRAHADELAWIESLEVGKPINQARPFDVENLIWSFDYFGGLCDKLPANFVDFGPIDVVVRLEPYGVVAGIIPFNWPPIHTGAKTAPALAVGNTVVLKPGEQAPLTIMRIVELLNTILPKDVLHVVPGHGPSAGRALASHRHVRKISFTGSTTTGSAVLRAAAENITPVLLELGGNNPFVVFEDADIDRAVAGALEGAFYNQGEACTAASRLIVHRSIHDVFVAKLSCAVRGLRVGEGVDPKVHVGPLVTRAQQKKVLDYIDIGVREGAVIAAQAPLPAEPRLTAGFFAPPTLFVNVTPAMRIAKEEIFGPVACVMGFDTFQEAIRIANDTEYGLVAGVYSRNEETARRAARRIDAGIVFVNNYNRAVMGTPFGGTKASGYGREHSVDTLREFGRFKAVRTPNGEGPVPRWFAVEELLGRDI
jgi:acyl-CoA reductase-like NAD-dependent aldehyde dehydrogenase